MSENQTFTLSTQNVDLTGQKFIAKKDLEPHYFINGTYSFTKGDIVEVLECVENRKIHTDYITIAKSCYPIQIFSIHKNIFFENFEIYNESDQPKPAHTPLFTPEEKDKILEAVKIILEKL